MSKSHKPNYSESELLIFLKLLEGKRELISFDSGLFGDELRSAWDELASEFSCQSAVPRTGDELKCKFSDLKSRTKKKISNIAQHQKSTGGAPPKELSEIDKLVETLAGANAMRGFTYYADSFHEEPIQIVVSDDDNYDAKAIPTSANANITSANFNSKARLNGATKKKHFQDHDKLNDANAKPASFDFVANERLNTATTKRNFKTKKIKRKCVKEDNIDEELLAIAKKILEIASETLSILKSIKEESTNRNTILQEISKTLKKSNSNKENYLEDDGIQVDVELI